MATREEIENLKQGWAKDPIWDIEETEGFEEHREELVAFRVKMQSQWNAEYEQARPKRIGDYRKVLDRLEDNVTGDHPDYVSVNAQTQLIIARALIDIAEKMGSSFDA